MAAPRSSLKRKPLSDCTNTIAVRSNAVRRKPSLRSALTQPPNSCSQNDDGAPISSLKSNTSIGSNNPPLSTSARSALLSGSHGSENEEIEKRKEKGKALVEDSVVQVVVLDDSENEERRRRKEKGKALVEDTVAQSALDGREYEEARRRKGKALVEDTVAQSALDGREYEEARRRKGKGLALVEDTVTQFALDGRENEEAKRRKDKGKAIMEDTIVQLDPVPPLRIKLSSATVPDVRGNQETTKRKDKGKAVVEDTLFQPDAVSPLTKKLSSATVPDSSRCRTVYTRKRVPEARNLRSLKIAEPFSCPPLRRLKDKRKKIDVGGGDVKSGMHRHSLSVPKKQSHANSKQKVPADVMPKEEVEKLRAYYADIDAFELPVEEADDSD